MNPLANALTNMISRNWWVLLLRGLFAVAFGVLSWMMPGVSLASLVLLFGIYALSDGILGLMGAFAGRKENDDWWVLLLWALVSIGAGVMTFIAPGITELALLFYIAAWSVATGVLQIVMAIRLRKEIQGEWMLILAGLASVVFGLVLMARPLAGAIALIWLIASYAVFFGLLMIFLSFKAKSLGKKSA
ncbi:MAG: HdeD family acid-resistance protein [Verrucomicrobiales bacterium]|nr:HdeD family acid-resistance protein [Verrucomicrobiales bacterium]